MIVKNNGNFIRHIGDVRLIPGANDVPEQLKGTFESELEKPLNAALVESKEIVIQTKAKGGSADKTTDMKVNDAIALISDTFDKTLLEAWLDDEKSANKPRTSVIKSIEEQIETQFNADGTPVGNLDDKE